MARKDRDFEMRMSGMLYAYKIAKEQGMEALEQDIRTRNVLKVPLGYSKEDIDAFLEYLKENFYHSIMTVSCIALEDAFGFKKVRLQRFQEAFARATCNTMDLDYIGENYVTLEDYAVYLKEKYDLDVDTKVVQLCQENGNANHPEYHMVKAERLIEVMRQDGYEDAAAYLEWRAGIIERPPKPKNAAGKTEIQQRGRTYDRRKKDRKRA